MNKTSQELHYTRAMRFLNKLHEFVRDGKYDKEGEKNFFIRLVPMCRQNPFTMFELNNFMLTCSIGVIGLNKEAIENSNRNNNYGFNIEYLEPRFSIIEKFYREFKLENIVPTGLEEWLSVTNVSSNISPSNNYLFNVRNALMHSEYEYEFVDESMYVAPFLNLHNSNYTGFTGKMFLSNYLQFVKQYYSNDAFFGLLTDFYFIESDNKIVRLNKEKILDQLSALHFYKLKYENDTTLQNMIEKKLINEKTFTKYIGKHSDDKEEIVIDDYKRNQVKLLIEHYYGEKFYKMKYEEQMRIIVTIYKYLIDPKMIMSHWIMHFYNLASATAHASYADEDFISIFAAEPSIAILKSYMVMYRLQNPSFKDLDYNLIEDINYDFLEDDQDVYEKQKNSWLRVNPSMRQSEIDKRYFCEVYRDSLAHGKIKIDVLMEDNKLKQKLIFEDIYKGKRRVISIDIKELNKFIESKAFSDGEAIDKSKVNTPRR